MNGVVRALYELSRARLVCISNNRPPLNFLAYLCGDKPITLQAVDITKIYPDVDAICWVIIKERICAN